MYEVLRVLFCDLPVAQVQDVLKVLEGELGELPDVGPFLFEEPQERGRNRVCLDIKVGWGR